jgi:type I restriction enzyme R subunit
MTATPLRDDNRDTYAYFGNPLYTYSLRQGIEDGFLAPYIVHRVLTDVDAAGWRPQSGQTDKHGKLIPDGVYSTPDFERSLSLLPRTKAVARHLTEHLKQNGRQDKTIVFCVDQEHADQMRRELNNLNSDLSQQNPNYVVRIVSNEGKTGKGLLSKFMDYEPLEKPDTPVIVTTSQMLSTGVDVPTCKNIVLFRMVNSMTEFKQIIGRGTRVKEEKGKLYFTILDYTGSATRKFADPEFDGEPPVITSEEIDENGQTVDGSFLAERTTQEPQEWTEAEAEAASKVIEPRKKYVVEEGEVKIEVESVQVLDDSGKLRTIEFTQYAKEQFSSLFTDVGKFRESWAYPTERRRILRELENRGISLE